MINGYRIYDADAHVNVAPQMREDLPKEFAARRDISDRQKQKILYDNPIRLFGAA
jgi:hypothetical protein